MYLKIKKSLATISLAMASIVASPSPVLAVPSGLIFDGNVSANEITNGGLCVVAAHMDDESLWMLPALYPSAKIIWAGIARGPAQATVQSTWPYWSNGKLEWTLGTASLSVYQSFWLNADARRSFYSDYNNLVPNLQRAVSYAGCHNILTHSPWGEYGHWHHRQLFKAANSVAQTLNLDLWFDGIVVPSYDPTPQHPEGDYYNLRDNTYWEFDPASGDYVYGDYDEGEFNALRALYQNVTYPYNAWTWSNTYSPAHAQSYWKIWRLRHNGANDPDVASEAVYLREQVIPIYGD